MTLWHCAVPESLDVFGAQVNSMCWNCAK